MKTGTFQGVPLDVAPTSGVSVKRFAAGTLSEEQFLRSESSMISSKGHCNTMGTASTMALLAEALGMTIPGSAGTPAVDARLLENSFETGRIIVELVNESRRPSTLITKGSFQNAIVALAAVGGSTTRWCTCSRLRDDWASTWFSTTSTRSALAFPFS